MKSTFNNQSPEYQIYMQSPQWARIRAAVFQRDRKICQGCLRNTATEVHHLTYANVYAEFMFELVALCSDCHGRLHGVEPLKRKVQPSRLLAGLQKIEAGIAERAKAEALKNGEAA
jgi:5-methylcytosine-specific restriction endonuclease McrA